MTGNDTNTKGTTMKATESYYAGQRVWTIFTDCVCENVVAEVSAEYVRLKSRARSNSWHSPGSVFLTKRDASVALAKKFRCRADALLKAAEELECDAGECCDSVLCRHGVDA